MLSVLTLALTTAATTPTPQLVLYTFGPRESLYTRFGHAALCIIEGEGGTCYNYGVADFSRHFGLFVEIAMGRAHFWSRVEEHQRY